MSQPDLHQGELESSDDLDREDRLAAHRDRLLGLRYAIAGALDPGSPERQGLLQLVEDALTAFEKETDLPRRFIKPHPPPD
jgi:hypothetical protein